MNFFLQIYKEHDECMNKIKNYNKTVFEEIKHIDDNDNEYWYARKLQNALEYKKWQKFINVINNTI